MHTNINKDVYINGTNDNLSVANSFVTHFESVYSSTTNDCDKNEFETLLNAMPFDESCTDLLSNINVALLIHVSEN